MQPCPFFFIWFDSADKGFHTYHTSGVGKLALANDKEDQDDAEFPSANSNPIDNRSPAQEQSTSSFVLVVCQIGPACLVGLMDIKGISEPFTN